MKRNVILAALAVALLAAVPASAAPPFGSFGGKVGGGNSGAGILPLHGWALDDNGVESVDILVDGLVVGRAAYGRSRPEVRRRFPNFPDSAAAGYAFELDTTRYLNGLHTITARVKSKAGEFTTLNSRVFQFLNVQHNLAPFGRIEFPNSDAELFGVCNVTDPVRRYSVISGYALDAGVQDQDHGVAYVELLLDREIVRNSRVSCRFSAVEGGLTDCYGLRRLDIEPRFPGLRNAPHPGFRFVLDVGALIAGGIVPGAHTLTIRAGDLAGQTRNISEIPVTFTCNDFLGNENSFGEIGVPRVGMTFAGIVEASGWVLDWEGVREIIVMVDSVPVGLATHGLARPQVTSLHPGYPESAGPGWTLSFDTRPFSNGEHFLGVLVIDDTGAETLIGERRFVIGNPVP